MKNNLKFIVTLLLLIGNIYLVDAQSNVSVSAQPVSPTQIMVSWQGMESTLNNANISFCGGATVGEVANSQSYLINNLTSNTAYSIKVVLSDDANNSVQSDCVAVKTMAKPSFKLKSTQQ